MLPASGCDLPAPDAPSGRDWSDDELTAWSELWASPQATMWDESAGLVIAAYLVHVRAVLAGSASAWQAQEARHLADRLGLTPAGLASAGWRIADPGEVTEIVPLRGVS